MYWSCKRSIKGSTERWMNTDETIGKKIWTWLWTAQAASKWFNSSLGIRVMLMFWISQTTYTGFLLIVNAWNCVLFIKKLYASFMNNALCGCRIMAVNSGVSCVLCWSKLHMCIYEYKCGCSYRLCLFNFCVLVDGELVWVKCPFGPFYSAVVH